ncbi:hypothetical protein VM1G_05861 [Cytospora mali]|uniref:Uncharacterized protein n=1 Tax=Cytospora mali TaxID=578113 RepID=A0A194W397_CYTMA|nr:hypothetical protein VM1G_05861 [Valsa mali]
MAAPAPAPSSPLPTTINIRETPAVAEWTAQVVDGQDADATTHCHLARSSNSSLITFSLFFDPSSNAAHFKLRATIFVHDSSRDKTPTSVFLFIYPEHVASLVHDQLSTLPPEFTATAPNKLSDCRTTCLRFTLNKPASLIAPLHLPIAPRSKKDVQVLRSLQILASTTTLAVYFAYDALPASGLISLVCDAAAKNALKPSLNLGDLSQLYGGQGGKAIEDFQDWPVPVAKGEKKTAAPETVESPPSYDELGPGPALPGPARSLKRRRSNLGYADGATDPPDVLAICRKAMTEQMTLIRGEIRDEIRREVKAQLGELENGIMKRVDKRLEEQISELRVDLTGQIDGTEERMDEIERHMDDHIDEEIEDMVLGVKLDMQDFVKDEIANVEDTIIKHFEDGKISLQFER